MWDLAMIGAVIGFFALSIALVTLFERLRGGPR